jgi:hypothetical protein
LVFIETTAIKSTVFPVGALPVASGFEDSFGFLFVEPLQELLKAFIRTDIGNTVEIVTQLIMRPGLVDEIFAAMTRRGDFLAALTTRHHVMPARRHSPQAEDAGVVHRWIQVYRKVQASKCKMVAREGIAPSTSLCKRDMILFHHRAVELDI